MKRRQLAAIVLSAILSFSACIPATGFGVYAAENDANPELAALETVEEGGSDEIAEPEAAGQAESALENAGETVESLPEEFAEQSAEQAQADEGIQEAYVLEENARDAAQDSIQDNTFDSVQESIQDETTDSSQDAFDTLPGDAPAETDPAEDVAAVDTAADAFADTEAGAAADATADTEAGAAADTTADTEAGAATDAFADIEAGAEAGAAADATADTEADTAASGDEAAAGTSEITAPDGSGAGGDDLETAVEEDGWQEDVSDFETVIEEDGWQEDVSEKGAGGSVEANEEHFANASEIAAGDIVDVNITNQAPAFFRFTPEESGKYLIYSTCSDYNPAMYLYEEYEQIGGSDDENDRNFRYIASLEAGKTYYIQAYCFDSQAQYQLHLTKVQLSAQAVDGITEFYLEKGASQTLQVAATAGEGEEITYRWYKSSGSELTSDDSDPASCTVENVQSYTEICCDVMDESGYTETVYFSLYVNGVITAWPSGQAPDVDSRYITTQRGNTEYLAVSINTDVQDYSIVWYDENDQILQDDNSDGYELSDIQENRTIRCHVADANDPDNFADVYFYITIEVEFYVYPEGGDRDNWSIDVDITGRDSVTLRTVVDTDGSTGGMTYKWEAKKFLDSDITELSDIQGDTCEVSMPQKGEYFCTVTDAEGHSGTARFCLIMENEWGFSVFGYDRYGSQTYDREITYDADDNDGPVELMIGVDTGVTDRLSYQWYKDTGSGEELIDGAVAPEYTVDNPVNGTAYTCIVDYGYGDEPKALTYLFRHFNCLYVYADTERLVEAVTYDPREAESFTLSPYVTADDMEGLTYEWKKGHGSDGIYTPTGDTSPSLIVSSPADEDVYTCTVTDRYGNQGTGWFYFYADTHLRIYAAEDPSKQYLYYIDITGKETLTLNAVAEADEGTPLTYHWQKMDAWGGNYIIDGASGGLTGGGPIALQLDTLEAGTAYSCYLRDEYNHEAILEIHLVSGTPALNIYPGGASEGEDTAVVNVGYGEASVELAVNSITDSEGFYYTWKNAAGETVYSSYNVPNYYAEQPKEGERYSCTVTDRFGQEAVVWFDLHIEKNPEAPTEEEMEAARVIRAGETTVVQAEGGSRGAFLAFTPEEDGYYVLYSSRDEDYYEPCGDLFRQTGSMVASEVCNKGDGNFLIHTNLNAGDTYYLRVYCDQSFDCSIYVEKTDFYACSDGPVNRSDYLGEACQIRVNTWSKTDVSYQWYEGDAEGNESSFAKVDGEAGNQYTPVIERDCSFMCRVSDQDGHSQDIVYYIKAEINHDPKDSEFENAQEIHPGDTREITLTEEHFAETYKFTAENSGRYAFEVKDEEDEFCSYMDIFTKETYEDEYEPYSYYSQTDRGDYFKYDMNAGDTVYLRIFDDQYRPGSCTLRVEHVPFWAEPSTGQSAYVDQGEEVTFGVRAGSSASGIHYQWYEKESMYSDEYIPIEGAAADSYTFIARKDLNLQCLVTDDSGNSETLDFYVTINREPVEQDFADAAVVKAGDSVQVDLDPENFAKFFKFVPDKTAAYMITFSSDDGTNFSYERLDLYDTDHNQIAADGGTDGEETGFLCTFLGREGETYYIRAYSDGYYSTGSFTLSLAETDFYAGGSELDRQISPGEETSFEVTAWSPADLHYQWYYSTESEYYSEEEPHEIWSATEASYKTDSPLTGFYTCKVWDDDGHSEDVNFHLRVDNNFGSYEDYSELTCQPGESTVLTINVSPGDTEGLEYRWEKYDNTSDSWIEIKGASGSSYTIPETEESTQYNGIVTDRYNNRFCAIFMVSVDNQFSATYVLHDNQEVIDDVPTITLYADGSLDTVLEVKAQGNDTGGLTYEWGCKSGDQSTITLEETSNRCIPQYDGYYFCRVTDRFGNTTEVTFRVIIVNDPHFTNTDDIEMEYVDGEPITLKVGAIALNQDSLRYLWYKYVDTYDTVFLGETSENSYQITPEEDEERYFCCLTDIYRHYDDSSQVNFIVRKIPGISLASAELTVSADGLTYDGSAKTPAVTVKYDGKELKAGEDYEVAYENNTDAGTDTAKVIVTGNGNYVGTAEKTFSIARAAQTLQADDLSVVFAAKKAVSVTGAQGDVTFTSGTPAVASVDADGNVTGKAVGSAKITISAAGDKNYLSAAKEITVTVTAAALKAGNVTVSADGLTYDGSAKTPAVTVKYDGKELKAGEDYEVAYENNTDAGTDTAKVTVTGNGNYVGTVEKTFSIARAAQTLQADDLSVVFAAKKAVSVTGAQGDVTFTSGTPAVASVDADGNVTGKAVGSTKITITAEGDKNYLSAKKVITVTVTAAALKAGNVTVDASGLTYNGKEHKPAVTVKYAGKILAANTDYKVAYKNNINAGTDAASVTVTGLGNYKSAVTKNFSIAQAGQTLTIAAVKVAVGKTATISVKGAKGTKSFSSANTTIATVNKTTGVVTGKKVGTVKITVKSKATSNYKAASKTITVKVLPAATSKITASNLAAGIKVTWNKVAGASGYLLYRNGTKIATLTGNAKVTYTDSKANTNGTKYIYKVVARAVIGSSTLNSTASRSLTTYRVARPAVSSLTNSAASKMTVKWAKNAKANGYQIQYSTDSTFKSGVKTVTISSAATVSKVIASLTKTKTYCVRMRTFKTVSATRYYSAWSAVKKLKITK